MRLLAVFVEVGGVREREKKGYSSAYYIRTQINKQTNKQTNSYIQTPTNRVAGTHQGPVPTLPPLT